jgi:hypothetical protein
MSMYNIWGYNHLIIPKFDFLLKLSSGRSLFLDDKYMKYFALICLIGGVKMMYHLSQRIHNFTLKMKYRLNPPKVKEGNYAVLLGFGDSEFSIKLAKFFSERVGLHLLLLNNKNIIDVRKETNLNEINGLNKLPTDFYMMTYDEYLNLNEENLKSLFKDNKIDFIFDCSIIRVIKNFGEDTKTQIKGIFYVDEINEALKNFHATMTSLLPYINKHSKYHFIDYLDKDDEVNHKLLFDQKYQIISNYTTIFKEKFSCLKKIKIRFKKLIPENKLENIYIYSELPKENFNF